MNKIIKTVKKEDKSFDSSALRRANANIEVYSPEELAHFGVIGMKWGVRNDRSSANQKKEERSLNKAVRKAVRLANRKYLKVYNAMADESAAFAAVINNKPAYKGKLIPFDDNNPLTKRYMTEYAKAATESLQRNSDKILGNKIDSRLAVKWHMGSNLGEMPLFYVDRVDPDVKHSEDISDDRINLVAKFDSYGHVISLSLPEGAEDEFISDEDGDDQDENDDEG